MKGLSRSTHGMSRDQGSSARFSEYKKREDEMDGLASSLCLKYEWWFVTKISEKSDVLREKKKRYSAALEQLEKSHTANADVDADDGLQRTTRLRPATKTLNEQEDSNRSVSSVPQNNEATQDERQLWVEYTVRVTQQADDIMTANGIQP